jgi:hypothetical protein
MNFARDPSDGRASIEFSKQSETEVTEASAAAAEGRGFARPKRCMAALETCIGGYIAAAAPRRCN